MDTIKALDYQATLDQIDQVTSDIVNHNSGNVNYLLAENNLPVVLYDQLQTMNEVKLVYSHNLSLINAILTQLQSVLNIANNFTKILVDISDPSMLNNSVISRFLSMYTLFLRTAANSLFDGKKTIFVSTQDAGLSLGNQETITFNIVSGTVVRKIDYDNTIDFTFSGLWRDAGGNIDIAQTTLSKYLGKSYGILSAINKKMDELKRLKVLFTNLQDNVSLSVMRVSNQLKSESDKILQKLQQQKTLLTCQKYELQRSIMPEREFDKTDFA